MGIFTLHKSMLDVRCSIDICIERTFRGAEARQISAAHHLGISVSIPCECGLTSSVDLVPLGRELPQAD